MTRTIAFALLTLLMLTQPALASDHLDTAAVIADPAGDIADIYAWTSSDGRRLNLVMTIVGGKFSDHVRYTFHIDSGRKLGATSKTTSISCEFNTAIAPECHAGDFDYLRGDASGEAGIEGERRRFRVFAGVRDDPFFNNVRGTRAALNVAGAALPASARDAAGCPRFGAATSARILDEWRHTEGHAGANLLTGWKTAALAIEVDLDAVNQGGPLLGVWATTVVRGVTPGHPRKLDDGVVIDRMGRALTGNALLGTFDSEAASDLRKTQYNQAPQEQWNSFTADLAATLAIYDAFDGRCGNQWLGARHSRAVGRYDRLARLLADDRLWVNSASKSCRRYLTAEFSQAGTENRDCGGRTPNYDAVDIFRSLLVMGKITGVDDGVARDERAHSDARSPFLAAP